MKTDKPGDASQIRPIDIHSVLVRAVTSSVTSLLTLWAKDIVHPHQFSLTGGTRPALAILALHTELTYIGAATTWAISLDYSKLFNRLAPEIGAQVARYAGLSEDTIALLLMPTTMCGQWRLACQAKPETFNNTRGLGQGLSTSVLLAELCLTPLLRRIAAMGVGEVVVSYVDDINFLCSSKETLCRILTLILDFTAHFCLPLADSHDYPGALELARQWGFVAATSIQVLGAEWPVAQHHTYAPTYDKEAKRIDEACRRLERLRHIPLHVLEKMNIASTGCLATLTYVNPPSPISARALRMPLKCALRLPLAAPEVLMFGIASSILDPAYKWLIAGLAIWWHVLRVGITQEQIGSIKRHRPRTRLSWILHEAEKYGIMINSRSFEINERQFPVSWEWIIARKAIEKCVREDAFHRIATRRPNMFHGISSLNAKLMRKFLKTLSNLHAQTLMKLWTGNAFTGHLRSLITRKPCPCACGEEDPTVTHVLWCCPNSPIPSIAVMRWKDLPAAFSTSHLYGAALPDNLIHSWKLSCRRAIAILLSKSWEGEEREHNARRQEHNGHAIAYSVQESYVYCGRCHIARRTRDAKWLFARPCLRHQEPPLFEGEEFRIRGHEGQLVLSRWKSSALRPAYKCRLCDTMVWATAGYRHECTQARQGGT